MAGDPGRRAYHHRHQYGKIRYQQKAIGKLWREVYCFMADEDVAEEARKHGITRACASMDKAARLGLNGIFAIGNAPTAPGASS